MKVVIAGAFPESTKARIRECFPHDWTVTICRPEEAERELRDAEVLIPEHVAVDAALLEKAPRLKLVQTGAGYDNVDLAACTHTGVQVCNASGINAAAVAEHVMALILCWYKNIARLDRSMKTEPDRGVPEYYGAELSGKTLGIVGLGNVGKRLASFAKAFDMRVLGYSYRPIESDGVECCNLERLYRESDIVSLHIPLKEDTRHSIDASVFAQMKPDALLVNTSRGAIVDEADLIEALQQGRIGGACLDVFEEEPLRSDSPLRQLDNVILTPHTAGLPDGVKFHRKRYEFFAHNIEKLLQGESPECKVNELSF